MLKLLKIFQMYAFIYVWSLIGVFQIRGKCLATIPLKICCVTLTSTCTAFIVISITEAAIYTSSDGDSGTTLNSRYKISKHEDSTAYKYMKKVYMTTYKIQPV